MTASKNGQPRSVSERLKLARLKKGLAITQAAGLIGQEPEVWQGWEEGREMPYPQGLAAAAVMGVKPKWLAFGDSTG